MSKTVKVGTLRLIYLPGHSGRDNYGLVREDELKPALNELRKRLFPTQRGGAARTPRQETVKVPLYRRGGKGGLTASGVAVLHLPSLKDLELIDTFEVQITDPS